MLNLVYTEVLAEKINVPEISSMGNSMDKMCIEYGRAEQNVIYVSQAIAYYVW